MKRNVIVDFLVNFFPVFDYRVKGYSRRSLQSTRKGINSFTLGSRLEQQVHIYRACCQNSEQLISWWTRGGVVV